MGKCDVCGKEIETLTVCSACGGISFAYCAECLAYNREPYDALVGMGMLYEDFNENFREEILLPSLKFFCKTVKEFNDDVYKADEDFGKWAKEHRGILRGRR